MNTHCLESSRNPGWRAAPVSLQDTAATPKLVHRHLWGVILWSITMKGVPEYEFVYADTQRLTETQDFELKFQNCQSGAIQRAVVISRAGDDFWVHLQTQVMRRLR